VERCLRLIGLIKLNGDIVNWQEVLKKDPRRTKKARKKRKKGKATRTHNSKGEPKDYCAKEADKSYGLKGSAYKSGFMTQCRKRGGKMKSRK